MVVPITKIGRTGWGQGGLKNSVLNMLSLRLVNEVLYLCALKINGHVSLLWGPIFSCFVLIVRTSDDRGTHLSCGKIIFFSLSSNDLLESVSRHTFRNKS